MSPVSLVTGCSSGLGRAIAISLARRGSIVVATVRNEESVDDLRNELLAAAPSASVDVALLDVTDATAASVLVQDVERQHGPVEVLVNNAGVGYAGPIETIDMAVARNVMETNFWGPMALCRAVLPAMREQRRGVIINIASVAGILPSLMFNGVYTASKRALIALSESLASEVASFGVRVCCVEPGFFATSIMSNSARIPGHAVDTCYETDAAWIQQFMAHNVANGADPAAVIAAVEHFIDDVAAPLHMVVGEDAELFISMYRDTGTFEGWTALAMSFVESVAGPRPVPLWTDNSVEPVDLR